MMIETPTKYKQCQSTCGQLLSLDMFNVRRERIAVDPDARHPHCRKCSAVNNQIKGFAAESLGYNRGLGGFSLWYRKATKDERDAAITFVHGEIAAGKIIIAGDPIHIPEAARGGAKTGGATPAYSGILLPDPTTKMFREDYKGVFGEGELPKKRAPQTGKTVEQVNAQTSWCYIIWPYDLHNGYGRDIFKVGNSQEEPKRYVLTRYLEYISPLNPFRGLHFFDLIYQFVRDGRVAEGQALIHMEAAANAALGGLVPDTRESFLYPGSVDPSSVARLSARASFSECMEVHGGILRFDRVVFETSGGERFV